MNSKLENGIPVEVWEVVYKVFDSKIILIFLIVVFVLFFITAFFTGIWCMYFLVSNLDMILEV